MNPKDNCMKSNAVYKIEITKCKDSSTNNTDKKANATNDLQSQVDQEGEQDWSQEPAKKRNQGPSMYARLDAAVMPGSKNTLLASGEETEHVLFSNMWLRIMMEIKKMRSL